MSVVYSIARALVHGRLALEGFTDAALADPAVRELMARIELIVDPAAHGERQTVEISTRDGGCLRSRIETPRGHWDNPLSDAELRAKFLDLATPALGPTASAVADLVARLDTPSTLTRLLDLLRAR